MVASNHVRCSEYPAQIAHTDIRAANPASKCCGYCGELWAKAIAVDDDDDFAMPQQPLRTPTSSARGH